MSSLRLALKQSLQETGHLLKDKKKKSSGKHKHKHKKSSKSSNSNSSSSNRIRSRTNHPNDPPRKRGRPRKHPRPEEEEEEAAHDDDQESDHHNDNDNEDSDSDNDDHNDHNDNEEEEDDDDDASPRGNDEDRRRRRHGESDRSTEDSQSENEFSYDSEAEEEDSEEEEDEEGEVEEGQQDETPIKKGALDEEEEEEEDRQQSVTPQTKDEKDSGEDEPKVQSNDSQQSPNIGGGDDGDKQVTETEEEERRKKKIFKKHLQMAANRIQAQWKRKKGLPASASTPEHDSHEEDGHDDNDDHNDNDHDGDDDHDDVHDHEEDTSRSRKASSFHNQQDDEEVHSSPTHGGETLKKKKQKKKKKLKTVPPPVPEILEWNRSLSDKKSRKHVTSGLRVKVRFAARVKREGKVVKKKIWYGGRVSAVSKEGSKIRIKYDDGTSEVSKFPDKDVVVDDAFNGQHAVPATKFIPPASAMIPVEDLEEEEGEFHEEPEPKKRSQEDMGDDTTTESKVQERSTEEPEESKAESNEPTPMETEDPDDARKPESSAPTLNELDSAETSKPAVSEAVQVDTDKPEAVTQHVEEDNNDNNEKKPSETNLVEDTATATATTPTVPDTDKSNPPEREEPPMAPTDDTPADSLEKEMKRQDSNLEKEETTESKVAPKSEEQVEGAKEGEESTYESPPTSKPTLTIRISTKAKAASQDEGKSTPKTPKRVESDSDEELFADTPVTERKVKSIQLKKKSKRKRENESAEEGGTDEPPSKKRIHLKQGKKKTSEEQMKQEDITEQLALPAISKPEAEPLETDTGDKPTPDAEEKPEKKSNLTLTISVRKPEVTEEELPVLPKLKAKKESSGSLTPTGGKSPVGRSRSPIPSAELATEPSNQGGGGEVGTESKELKQSSSTDDMGDLSNDGMTKKKLSKKARKEAAALAARMEGQGSESEEQAADGSGLQPSKVSTDSLPRTGRRAAAQQAKEKMNPKAEEKQADLLKRKKKRKRQEGGDEAGELSDESVDDRQWVQCDSCGKWRILPSHVKVSSLPAHWYCHLNTYDPKRHSCAAPEQTAKQAAKEWRRARKRLKQQRLALMEAAQLEKMPEEPKKDLTPSNSPKSAKATKKEKAEQRASPIGVEPVLSPPDLEAKSEKKGKKGKPQQPAVAVSTPTTEAEPPKKPGRKRGRPARNQTPEKKTDDGDNVEWVQCEKCEKWRKLPPHISADELPDKWYCTMNTWNPDSASCDAPEDQADATHHEVGTYAGQLAGAGKYSYRSMIFGTGKKHNRPMSERSRAAESLFMRPIDEIENPYPTVMYSKSSCFMARTSNFNRASVIEEEKPPSLFEVLVKSELFADLHSAHQPMEVTSSSRSHFPRFLSFENLPEETKEVMRDVVLRSLGLGCMTGDEVIAHVQAYPWETMSADLADVRKFFKTDVIINTLLALVRDGVVEMSNMRDYSIPTDQWIPRYRKVRSRRAIEIEESIKASRCMKISKPWKHREDGASWITGGTAFS